MKKIYVMAAFLGATTFAFNQVAENAPLRSIEKTTVANKTIASSGDYTKAAGTELWSDDFDTTQTSQWVIGHDTGSQGNWVVGSANGQVNAATQAHSGYYQLIQSTTAANGIAYFDGVQYLIQGPVLAQNAWIEMANPVDMSSEQVVTLQFQQAYRAFNSDSTLVEVSLDGGATWEQTINVNADIAVNLYATDLIKRINFTVNNSNQVKFRFRWFNSEVNDQFGSGYAWQIDDVSISSLADNDIKVNDYFYGLTGDPTIFGAAELISYSRIPLTQAHPITAVSFIKNEGLNDQTNVKFKAEETSQSYMSESVAATLLSGAADTVFVQAPFTPTANGSYKIDYSIESDDVDDVPGNNAMASYKFTVGDFLFARDTSTRAHDKVVYGQVESSTLSDGQTGELIKVIEPAVWYQITNQQTLYGIDFQFGDLVTPGAQVMGRLYQVTPDGSSIARTFLAETLPYDIQNGDSLTYQSLKFDNNGIALSPGTYIASVVCLDETGFSVATAGKVKIRGTVNVHAPSNTNTPWYGQNTIPVIRMNFDPTVSVNSNALSSLEVTQFPNPFANETTVSFSLEEASNVSYTITDMTGKVIANVNKGNLSTGNHEITVNGASLANGIYYFNLKTDNAQVTRKMVVSK